MAKTLWETSPRSVFAPAKRLLPKLLNEDIYTAVRCVTSAGFHFSWLKSCSCSNLNARGTCGSYSLQLFQWRARESSPALSETSAPSTTEAFICSLWTQFVHHFVLTHTQTRMHLKNLSNLRQHMYLVIPSTVIYSKKNKKKEMP